MGTRKIEEPNYQMLLNSAITALQQTYSDYKKAVITNLSLTWIGNDGVYTMLSGVEERNKKIADLQKEMTRLLFKVEEYKDIIKSKESEDD